ncbi:hypothetical protein [Microvirga splendida]|uniref:Uncharacterized protein n=1 Tax=Microvirga splendida TaxID=2795727 RepID=A0ABS0Y5H3_9HYPH|nr:hypothetical protein [Microvirga splendida]MBJ6127555.1 hypothetical protein [Microvirga splendida]
MGARKGQNNFKVHQSDVINAGLNRVKLALKALPGRTRFEDFNALARYVANAAGMHPTTMTRNPRYRKAVWDHIHAKPRIISGEPEQVQASVELEVLRIEAALLKRHNERLQKMLSNRLSHEFEATEAISCTNDGEARTNDLRRSFELTATVLARLLNWAAEKEIGIVADLDRGEILDAAEIGGNRVIAARPDTTAFIDWLKRHSGHAYGSDQS